MGGHVLTIKEADGSCKGVRAGREGILVWCVCKVVRAANGRTAVLWWLWMGRRFSPSAVSGRLILVEPAIHDFCTFLFCVLYVSESSTTIGFDSLPVATVVVGCVPHILVLLSVPYMTFLKTWAQSLIFCSYMPRAQAMIKPWSWNRSESSYCTQRTKAKKVIDSQF